MTTFHLPDLGEGLTEAEIVAWHVAPGDRVSAEQPLVSVETDKAVVEIPSPQSGVIAEIYGQPGDIIPVGAKLVEFAAGPRTDTGAVVGELPKEIPPPSAHPVEPTKPRWHAKATPAVRARAAKLGVDLATVSGTGPEGAITTQDVEAAVRGKPGAALPLRGVRRSMAMAMARSLAQVVPATVQDSARIDRWPPDADPTIRLIRAIMAGVKAEPGLNAWFDSEREELSVNPAIDLGIAMDRPEGLYVPVVRDVAALDDAGLREKLNQLKQRVADRSIARADLVGQTFTLSNFGMIAGRYVSLVIVPPQVAILGAGRIERQPAVIADSVTVCRMLPLSLTFDHRVVTGGEAGRFLAAVIADLEA